MPVHPSAGDPVLAALRALGSAATSAELQARLGVSQPTVSRALAPLVQAGLVHQVGAARSRRYLLPRSIAGIGRVVPVMRVDSEGQAAPFGQLIPLQGGRIWVDEADGVSEPHDGMPWFLNDMRPQGFMGRGFAHAHPELQLGDSPPTLATACAALPSRGGPSRLGAARRAYDPRQWNDDELLHALALFGDDLPGNLIVGEAAFQRYNNLPQRASHATSPADYAQMAAQAMQGALPGSSAGGEQPKFCTNIQGRAVIVKFSPAGTSDVDQRTRDLLVCEHLALQTLADAGVPAAVTQIHSIANRTFLEAERFDRTRPEGARAMGRIGMVSLMMYDAQYVGHMDNWAATANRMAARQLLTEADAARLRLLEAYGVLIANTDRHYGNISLLLEKSAWRLSPSYDMLPMLYAPVNGELVVRNFATQPLYPTAATLAEWPQARALAAVFWQRAASDGRISPGFQAIARQNLLHVQGL